MPRYSSPGDFVISRASTMLVTVTTPTANCPAVPCSVFASSTVSWRRNAHPSRRSWRTDRPPSAPVSSASPPSAGAAGSPGPPDAPAAPDSRAFVTLTIGGTTIVVSRTADAR